MIMLNSRILNNMTDICIILCIFKAIGFIMMSYGRIGKL